MREIKGKIQSCQNGHTKVHRPRTERKNPSKAQCEVALANAPHLLCEDPSYLNVQNQHLRKNTSDCPSRSCWTLRDENPKGEAARWEAVAPVERLDAAKRDRIDPKRIDKHSTALQREK